MFSLFKLFLNAHVGAWGGSRSLLGPLGEAFQVAQAIQTTILAHLWLYDPGYHLNFMLILVFFFYSFGLALEDLLGSPGVAKLTPNRPQFGPEGS